MEVSARGAALDAAAAARELMQLALVQLAQVQHELHRGVAIVSPVATNKVPSLHEMLGRTRLLTITLAARELGCGPQRLYRAIESSAEDGRPIAFPLARIGQDRAYVMTEYQVAEARERLARGDL